jgi:cellulose 1,4-beta-cellobiosidase
MGNQDFYGTSKTVDTSKPFTIVTQFITDSGTDTGNLQAIKRFYVQGGTVIPNSVASVAGVDPVNDITDQFCAQQKTAFGDNNYFATIGGLAKMGEQLKKMVLVLSVWDDHDVGMNWLDSNYPVDADAAKPGISRGRCDSAAGDPKTLEAAHPDASVIYSNIKLGAINSTFKAT